MNQQVQEAFERRMSEAVAPFPIPATPMCMTMLSDVGMAFGVEVGTYAAALNTFGDALMVSCLADAGVKSAHTQTDFKAVAALLREAADMFDAVANRSAN